MSQRKVHLELTLKEAEAIASAFGEVFAGAFGECRTPQEVAAMRRADDKLWRAMVVNTAPYYADAPSDDCTCHWLNSSERDGWYLVSRDPKCPAHGEASS